MAGPQREADPARVPGAIDGVGLVTHRQLVRAIVREGQQRGDGRRRHLRPRVGQVHLHDAMDLPKYRAMRARLKPTVEGLDAVVAGRQPGAADGEHLREREGTSVA